MSVAFYRGRRIGIAYINEVIIPVLCRKAGVPTQDARGNITSHRGRSTIRLAALQSQRTNVLAPVGDKLLRRFLT